MIKPVLTVNKLGKCYKLAHSHSANSLKELITEVPRRLFSKKAEIPEDFWALRNASFTVNPGEAVGIVGKNGSGKSTLLKILSRITGPTEGTAAIHGTIATMLAAGAGFHHELTGRENIYLNGVVLGMTKKEISQRFDSIVEFSEVGHFLDVPLKRYSTGMSIRLGYAIASHLRPSLLILDEALATTDLAFQEKCIDNVRELTKSGTAVLFVSHQRENYEALCSRIILVNKGAIIKDSLDVKATLDYYDHVIVHGESENRPAA